VQAEADAEVRPKRRSRRTAAELLESPPPPLIVDLEMLVTSALQNLISAAGASGISEGEELSPQEERDRLAHLSNSVVSAVRTLLHSAGVLEQINASSHPYATVPSERSPDSPESAIRNHGLSQTEQIELRPFVRRVSSALSKLTLSTRAVWGILETSLDDQDIGLSDLALQRPEGQRVLTAQREAARQKRVEVEAKLRADVLVAARDVQVTVMTFIGELERVLDESAALARGEAVPREMLRAPKAIQGSLRTNAAALILPGGGFGGNWRGNGFVTLPSPPRLSTPVPSGSLGSLQYAYPSHPLTPQVAATLRQKSTSLLAQIESLRHSITTLADSRSSSVSSFLPDPQPARSRLRPSSTSSLASLASLASRLSMSKSQLHASKRNDLARSLTNSSIQDREPSDKLVMDATALQSHLGRFLEEVEDIDVAASVECEVTGEVLSRPDSRINIFSSTTHATSNGASATQGSDMESLAETSLAAYRTSLQEARPLLAELETTKQALYDAAPALLMALQTLYMVPPAVALVASGGHSPQPHATAPLGEYKALVRDDGATPTLHEVLSDLTLGVERLCKTMTSLGAIAQVQQGAAALDDTQSLHKASHSSLAQGSASSSWRGAESHSTGRAKESSLSASTSRHSLAQTEDSVDLSVESRASSDSDFFSRGLDSAGGLKALDGPPKDWGMRPTSLAVVRPESMVSASVYSLEPSLRGASELSRTSSTRDPVSSGEEGGSLAGTSFPT
jgi:son of sevenless-like protein